MILTGTPILLATGKTKPVENLRKGDVLRGHTGRESTVRELIPLRSKKNILLVLGRAFIVMHHDQPVLTTYGWMRTRMLRIGDHLATFQSSGGGSADLLWTSEQRDWEGRLAKVDFRTLNVPPWPSPSIGKLARKAEVSRAHVRPILPESTRQWVAIVEKWDRLNNTENKAIDAWKQDQATAARREEPFAAPRPPKTTIAAFLASENSPHSPAYFSNWASKIRKLEEEGGSSQPGFDILCDGGFVIPVTGGAAPIHIICRDAAKYVKPPRSAQDEEDADEEEDDSESISATSISLADADSKRPSARTMVRGAPSLSSRTTPPSQVSAR